MNSFVKDSYRLLVLLGGLYTFPSISDLFDSIFAISINCPSHNLRIYVQIDITTIEFFANVNC